MASTTTSDDTPRTTSEQPRLPGADLVDRGLDRIEDGLPTLPAAVFRIQRSVAERIVDQSRRALCGVGDAVSSTATTAVHGTPMSYEHWTKKDLYELAQDRDIDGRSAMSKDELIAAIERTR